MEIVYRASFCVDNAEVWTSDLFLSKEDVLLDIENELDQIIMVVSDISSLPESEISKILDKAIKKIKRIDSYLDSENGFDFSISNACLWENIKEKKEAVVYIEPFGDTEIDENNL